MTHTKIHKLILLTMLVGISVAPADETKQGGKSDPPGVPVQARLESRKPSYNLDLGEMTAEQFRKQVKDADTSGAYPPAPAVDLVLTLHNSGDREVDIRVGGTTTIVTLDLQGPGALNVPLKRQITSKIVIAPRVVTLKPGQSEAVPITSLSYGFKGSHRAYWTEPGEYTLSASYRTAMSPAPKGSTDAGNGFGTVTLTSAPIKLKVKAKE
jgi:hypothetical protein